MPKTYLLSRALDPILGIFTGILAYQLHENNPRSAPAPGHTLRELVGWRWSEQTRARQAKEGAEDLGQAEWEAMAKALQDQSTSGAKV